MKNYIVFNGDGEILRTGICPDDMMNIQVQEGELVMEGKANDIEDRVAPCAGAWIETKNM